MLFSLFSSFDLKNFMFSLTFTMIIYLALMFKPLFKMDNFMLLLCKTFMFHFYNISKSFFMNIVFLVIFMSNMISLNLYNFSMTSHFFFNIPLTLTLWSPVLFMTFLKKNNKFLINLLPYSTPPLLMPILVLIELISFMMRPFTLLLRLSINLIAGHVLVALLGNSVMMSPYFLKSLLALTLFLYMCLKFMVSFIQAYIVITLMEMYISEV